MKESDSLKKRTVSLKTVIPALKVLALFNSCVEKCCIIFC